MAAAQDLAAQLNPAQLEAVYATDGPLLVIAGAGSGKTRVIEYRVLNLVRAVLGRDGLLRRLRDFQAPPQAKT